MKDTYDMHGVISIKRLHHKNIKGYGVFSYISNVYTYWIVSINIILIVIANPCIVNPGPPQQSSASGLSVLYHNARGFMSYNPRLPKNPPELNITKILNFQSYIFNHKPDVIVVNERWLNKTINSSEIFPNNSYKVFRLDRSCDTHPPDKNNPNKYRRGGGGVLIAVRSDLDIKSHLIKSKAKAEILSIILTNNNKKFCISTCYRVDTLRLENFTEIYKHLESICKRKDINKHILLGDFNLAGVTWPSGITTCKLENMFVDSFSDFNLTQLIDKPTHEKGKTLDLLLCDSPNIISSVHVQEKDEICSSDHFGISFLVNLNCKRLKCKKRKMYNFKKANWHYLNNELKHVNWNYVLKYYDPVTGWNRLSRSLGTVL